MSPHMVINEHGKIETVGSLPAAAGAAQASGQARKEQPRSTEQDEVLIERINFMRPSLLEELATGMRSTGSWSMDNVQQTTPRHQDHATCLDILARYRSWQKERDPETKKARTEAKIVLPYWLRAVGTDIFTAYPFGMPPGGALHVVMRLGASQVYVESMHTHIAVYKGEILLRSPALNVINYALYASYWTRRTRQEPMSYRAVMARMEHKLMKTFSSEYVECSLSDPDAMTPFLM